MLLKLESKDYFFSISCWDKGFDDDIDAWHDDIYNMYLNFPIENGKLLTVTKETLSTKGGNVKCIKVKYNINKFVQGQELKMKNVTYIVVRNGYLYIFSFISNGSFSKNSSTLFSDKIMKGLKFKVLKVSSDEQDFNSYVLEVVKGLNAQCPIQTDECTTFENVVLSGKSIIIKTNVPNECDPYVDYENFKTTMCYNYSKTLERAFVEYLKKENYTIIYMVYSEYNIYKTKIIISPQNILDYMY